LDHRHGITGMTDWSRLRHAYGTAEDLPALLDAAGAHPRAPEWDDLWSRVCHQGTVYTASYAALPALTAIARGRPPADRSMPLVLAGAILASTDRPHGHDDPRATYAAEITELRALTEQALSVPARDADAYVHLLQTLLALDGVEVWAQQLDRLNDGEYVVACPACAAENFVAFGRYGCFTTTDSMYMRDSAAPKLPLTPAAPATLRGPARSLHARALADGHPEIATALTYAFGHARCAECEAGFSVEAAVTAAHTDR
jgi:hypothetical protein